MSLFQSNLRKQIRNLPKILNFVKKFTIISELFTSLLTPDLRDAAQVVLHVDGVRAGADAEERDPGSEDVRTLVVLKWNFSCM